MLGCDNSHCGRKVSPPAFEHPGETIIYLDFRLPIALESPRREGDQEMLGLLRRVSTNALRRSLEA
jgi:hypothetical protein